MLAGWARTSLSAGAGSSRDGTLRWGPRALPCPRPVGVRRRAQRWSAVAATRSGRFWGLRRRGARPGWGPASADCWWVRRPAAWRSTGPCQRPGRLSRMGRPRRSSASRPQTVLQPSRPTCTLSSRCSGTCSCFYDVACPRRLGPRILVRRRHARRAGGTLSGRCWQRKLCGCGLVKAWPDWHKCFPVMGGVTETMPCSG
mmetsp:Transcript_91529/g.259248  ORF Transcript_91529/g.259248 Transcript_91529/m.259248 type:complete len:200 (+) Transcript_91529:159-758(+)